LSECHIRTVKLNGDVLYEVGTRLRFRKPIDILVLKGDEQETHTIEPGIECEIVSVGEEPAVEITSDAVLGVLRLWLSPDVDWPDYFDVIQYRHLIVVK